MGDGIRKTKAKTGITDFRPGSVIASILEVVASEDFEQYYQMVQIIRSSNVDTAEGDDLVQIAIEITGTGKLEATRSTGVVTVGDSAFTKISSKIYAGLPGPVLGQNYIYVNDASSFPASGTIIVGRGTDNVETVAYSSIDNLVNFFKINLSSALLHDHGTDETIILSQGGNRNIAAGTLVKVPQSDESFEVFFSVDVDSILLDGEDTLEEVAVTAVEAGSDGNVAARSIISFDSPPFPTATVINPSPFTNARAEETDQQIRDRIKTFIQTLSRGTPLSIVSAAIGVVDTEQNKRVVSAKLIDTTNLNDIPILYIDDGIGFEPTFDGIGNENVIAEATGGEQFLQLEQFPLVKAQVECLNEEPFPLSAGDTLTVSVEGSEETITFTVGDFTVQQAATAEEVATAINDRLTVVEARTSRVGKRIVLRAKRQENENLTVVGGTANTITKLNFPTTEFATLLLYKISGGALKVLSKDGITALIQNNAATIPIDITTFYHFKYSVDGRVDVEVDLRPIGLGGDYDGSYAFNTDVSLAELVVALNSTAPGITASLTSNGTRITLTSNTERSASSKVEVKAASSNDLNGKLNFPLVEIVGKDSDYTLNRFNGQIELKETLVAGDTITAGSVSTRGFLRGSVVGPFNLESGGADTLSFVIDNGPTQLITWSPSDFTDITQATPEEVIAVLNRDLKGATAIVDDDNTITIRTNFWKNNDLGSGGSIILTAIAGNGNAMGFPFDTEVDSISPHTPFLVSGNPENYDLKEGDQLIVVLDNDPQNKTFAVTMDLDCEVNVGDGSFPYNSFSGFVSNSSQDLGVKFTKDSDLVGMKVIFKSGDNFEASKVVTNGIDPAPVGATPIEVKIEPGATGTQIAAAIASVINPMSDFSASSTGPVVTVANASQGVTTDASDFNTGFGVSVTIQGVNPVAEVTQIVCVVRAQKEQTSITTPAASTLNPIGAGRYWTIKNANNVTSYYVWYRVTDGNVQSDPAPGGTGIQVNILLADSATSVAQKTAVAVNAVSASFVSATPGTPTLVVTNVNYGPSTDAADFNAGVTISVLTQGILGIQDGQYFTIQAGNDTVHYYVYYDTTGSNLVNPAPGGKVGIRVNISGTVTAQDVASATSAMLAANANFTSSYALDTVTVTAVATGPATDAANFNVGGTFSVTVMTQGAGALETTQFTAAADTNGNKSNRYFFIYSANNATKYYVWLNVNGNQNSKKFLRADSDVTTKFNADTDLTSFTTHIRWTSGSNKGTEQLVNFYQASTGIIGLSADAGFAIKVDDEFEVQIQDVVSTYNAGGNLVTTGGGWPNAIVSADTFIVIPRTAANVATFMNNTTVTTFSVAGRAEAVDSGTRVQLESKTIGNAGIVNVTGGSANDELGFSTVPSVGKDGYQFYTGLLRRVQRTIDGLDSNLAEFEGVRAAGVQIEVAAPTVRNVLIIMRITLSGLSVGAVANDIRSRVSNYINTLGLGEDVIISKIEEQVLKVTAVTDVEIQSPLLNIPIADNEVAKVLADDIIISS